MTDNPTPADLVGHTIGPVQVAVTADGVAAYVTATSGDPAAWVDEAPPGYASVLLFAVADGFLYDPRIIAYTATLMHVDQSFEYSTPIRAGTDQVVTGTISKVRERGGSFFVTFEATAESRGEVTVRSVSTFLLSNRAAERPPDEHTEPGVWEVARNERSGEALLRSASRSDLVRYAAATRDFNPLHWDHASAVSAGMPGVVVHGLLMLGWMVQAALTYGRIRSVKVRFKSALFPAEQAMVQATADGDTVRLFLDRDGETLVTGTATVMAEEA
ncbi:MAG: MaoC/PaaZ C-terminal domain-containing protein [Acidimicrobiia bacterium]